MLTVKQTTQSTSASISAWVNFRPRLVITSSIVSLWCDASDARSSLTYCQTSSPNNSCNCWHNLLANAAVIVVIPAKLIVISDLSWLNSCTCLASVIACLGVVAKFDLTAFLTLISCIPSPLSFLNVYKF